MTPTDNTTSPMELLAPAGTLEAFETAIAAGADAVYIGAPAFNARNLAKHFSYAEVAAMVDHAHKNGVKVYAAMNSLMKENEIREAVNTLGSLEALSIDAVIIQDLGIYHLAQKYFPDLRLHASTLLGAHNSLAIRQFSSMGFKRVVLAREMTMGEISAAHAANDVELEVFIHGALCFSYSGLCLFSSFLGGKSGLRGRCVQPCRRRYTWGGKGKAKLAGYLFSMHDLSGIQLLPKLQEAGVTSLKIEGRMRSAQYVDAVISGYRMALDNPGDKAALTEAMGILETAMGRKPTRGYFEKPQPKDILSPQHSGNIGMFLGKVERIKENRALVSLKAPLAKGDRLRLHNEKSGERQGFALKGLFFKNRSVSQGQKGQRVELELPGLAAKGDPLYKVDVTGRRGKKAHSAIKVAPWQKKVGRLVKQEWLNEVMRGELLKARMKNPQRRQEGKGRAGRSQRGRQVQLPLNWWLKVDDLKKLQISLPQSPNQVVVTLTRETMAQLGRMRKIIAPYRRRLTWALPPVILEGDLAFYEESIAQLIGQGFRSWQIAHIGQQLLFAQYAKAPVQAKPKAPMRGKKKRPPQQQPGALILYADYTLNAMNSLTLKVLRGFGVQKGQLAIEADKDTLAGVVQHKSGVETGLTVYGAPPLFTARLMPEFFQYERPLLSPRGEGIILKKRWGHTIAVAQQHFSLLAELSELAALGIHYAVVDLSQVDVRRGELSGIFKEISATKRNRRLSSFNYFGEMF